MWREGFDLALVAWILNAMALAFGAYLGGRGLIDPHWAQRLVRLKEGEAGGFAEFRATYGGVFLGLHAVALLFTLGWIVFGGGVIGIYASGAAAALAAGWGGSAVGRAAAMLFDRARTRFNEISFALEAMLALMIGSPWLVWWFGGGR